MDNKELLELSAKAYGCVGLEYRSGSNAFYYDDPESGREEWNPLEDDGAVLRLAVRLNLEINIGTKFTLAVSKPIGDGVRVIVEHLGDPAGATRIAIVRAAAEIQKANEENNCGNR